MAWLSCGIAYHGEGPTEFTLKSATDDSVFDLADHRGKTVVLHFLLKTECPLCLRYTRDYSMIAAKTPKVIHVFIKPDSVEEIKQWTSHLDAKALKTAPTIYRDPDAALADKFDIPDGYEFHGQSVHFPATIVLDGEGRELFRYVGKSNSDRLSSKEFLSKLESMQEPVGK
jgi:peroxiredoxin Q/BCP